MTNREKERARLVEAMDILATAVNNEDYLDAWLMGGVADGDIHYEMEETARLQEIIDIGYTSDDELKRIIGLFLRCMDHAKYDGGLYVDGVVGQ